MLAAGRQANARGIPVVLDPVGVGASAFRRRAVQTLLAEIRLSALRCNLSELHTLTDPAYHSAGVDAACTEAADALSRASALARQLGAIVIASGAEDLVTDGMTSYRIRNGHPIQKQITGAGCMLTAMVGACLAAGCTVGHCTAAVCMMGLAGETAAARMTAQDGNATCRNYLIDAVYRMTDEQLEEGARIEPVT
jgi:hydroxyethylthiazole kinase